MKRIISFILLIVMLLTFGACSGSGPEDGGTATEGDLQNIADTYGIWTDQSLEIMAIEKGLGTQWLKDAAIIFNKATGSKIQVKADETLNEGLQQYIDADSGADIYFTFSAQSQWVRWEKKKKIIPLDDLDLQPSDENFAKLGIYDGVRYIMPYTYNGVGFVYNQEYLDEIPSNGEYTQGTFPTTWQGLLDLCDVVNTTWEKTVNGQRVVPFTWGGAVNDMSYIFNALWAQIDYEGFNAYFNQSNLNITGEKNKSLLVNDSTVQVLNSIAKLFNAKPNDKNQYYPSNAPTSLNDSNLTAEQKFINGSSVFTISGAWFENEMREYIEETEVDFYHFSPVPKVNPDGEDVIWINSPAEYFMIAANGKNNNVSLAKAFLKYMSSPFCMINYNLSTGCPGCFDYTVPETGLTTFAEEVSTITKTYANAFSASDQITSLSGAIQLETKSLITTLATTALTDNLALTELEKLYETQYINWNDTIRNFQSGN